MSSVQEALEEALERGMLASDHINRAVEHLSRLAGQNTDPRIKQFILDVALQLKEARGDIKRTNAILDQALYTVRRRGIDEHIIERGR